MCENDYGIKRKIISMQNPQAANAIVEHAHLMLRNLIRSFKLQDNSYLDSDDLWLGILAAASFASLDSFADHFLRHCTVGMKPMNEQLRRILKYQILWQANPISCMKTFGKLNCAFCM